MWATKSQRERKSQFNLGSIDSIVADSSIVIQTIYEKMFGSSFGKGVSAGFGSTGSSSSTQNGPKSQESDFKFPNPPQDGISSLSINGSTSAPPNCVIATAWDSTVSCYQVNYGGNGVASVVPQSQIKHDAPVLCSDFGSVSIS
jgi:hypothetical protein